MHFEHFAINVPDPVAMAKWYVEHLRMRVASAMAEEPFTHFLADEGGRVVMEIYNNPIGAIPDYASQHPLQFHLAFAVEDPRADQPRLETAGATLVEEVVLDDGSVLIMMRDPWGVPLQLCRRTTPFSV